MTDGERHDAEMAVDVGGRLKYPIIEEHPVSILGN